MVFVEKGNTFGRLLCSIKTWYVDDSDHCSEGDNSTAVPVQGAFSLVWTHLAAECML